MIQTIVFQFLKRKRQETKSYSIFKRKMKKLMKLLSMMKINKSMNNKVKINPRFMPKRSM